MTLFSERSPKRNILVGLLIAFSPSLILTLALSACQTTASVATDPAPVNAVCLAFKPIYWSKNDTLETQKQARGHNAAGVAMCGWKP